MKTQIFSPSSAISPYVSSILVIEDANEKSEFVIPLFANGSPTLVFQTANGQTIGNLTLYGQMIKPQDLVLTESFTLIAYFFHPHVLRAMFGIQPKDITDGHVDLALLKSARNCSLKEQLLHEASINACLSLIDHYILKLINVHVIIDKKIEFAAAEIKSRCGIRILLCDSNDGTAFATGLRTIVISKKLLDDLRTPAAAGHILFRIAGLRSAPGGGTAQTHN